MTEPNPDHEPGHGPDDPDLEDPLTAEDIVSHPQAPRPPADSRSGGDSQATRLVSLAHGHFRLLQGDDGRPYATAHDGPALAFPLRGAKGGLRNRLARLYFATHHQAAGGAALSDALAILEGEAEDLDPEPVALRVTATGAHSIALDLGTADGRCVIVDLAGWRIVEQAPVLFRRSALTAPLPTPTRGGSLDPLAELLNVDEAGFRLIVAWLVAAFLPDIAHPILAVTGEQGTAKSTATRLAVCLVDPSPAPLRTPPREMRSWAASAAASWVVALDNVSAIPDWLSDTLCKAVTGDGIVERSLHTDDDLSILTFRRCIALTTIDAGRLAGDLAERMLGVELAPIPPERRRPETEITAAYAHAKPPILGALLDITAQALAELPAVQLDHLPRMADFAKLLAALDRTQGWNTLADYTEATADANRDVLDSDPVARAVTALARQRPWQGTHDELLRVITPDRPDRDWPRSARGLAGRLKRLAPALRGQAGVIIEHGGRSQNRLITLRHHQLDQLSEP
jgi:hypothetical protein